MLTFMAGQHDHLTLLLDDRFFHIDQKFDSFFFKILQMAVQLISVHIYRTETVEIRVIMSDLQLYNLTDSISSCYSDSVGPDNK